MSICMRAIVLAVAMSSAMTAFAKDSYYSIPIRDLKLTEGSLPVRKDPVDWRRQVQASQTMMPYAALDGEGEAYVIGRGEPTDTWQSWASPNWDGMPGGTNVIIRAPEGKDIVGRLFVPNGELTGMVSLPFKVATSAATPEAREQFYRWKIARYDNLARTDRPGVAWFRHEARLARAELKLPANDPQVQPRWQRGDLLELSHSYDLFTGGRAMSENLQLDRALIAGQPNETPVKIDSLGGITINEIDWKPLVGDAKPKLDPLAAKIPADQHVVFFPSFQAAIAVADETKQHDTPVLRLAEARSENAGVVERYQRQLGLSMSTLARLLGPTVVGSVAMTGSDPYYPTGTDVAVLFESPQPAVLEKLILGRIIMAVAQNSDVKPVQGEVSGLKYQGFRSPDRSVSSYVAVLDGTVVVTNSPYQLTRLAAVQKGEAKPISSLPEYVFFRIRYPLGDASETAFLFLSDPTIRRWCGPRWRIADSRRIRAAAVLAELQASQLDGLVRKTAKPGVIHTDLPILGGGEISLRPNGVVSENFGTLDFMTPIGECDLTEVTKAEAESYGRWRDGYQRNWSWGFDPIGLRISLGKDKLAADMSVMPLIVATQYRELISISSGSTFEPTAGDPHGSLAQLMLAINRQSPTIRSAENFAASMGQTISLGWLGKWVSVYADEDPFWKDLAKTEEKDLEKFMSKNIGRIPVGVRIDASNPLKLAMFLTSARAFIEQTSPGLTHWESLKYKDTPYVRITASKEGRGVPREFENIAIYYTAIDDALTVTLSEKILQGTIDRWLARKESQADGKAAAKDAKEWLGSNVALRVDRKILEIGNALLRRGYEEMMQRRCWDNLPILNEWKRLYPDRDPVEVHKLVWGVELLCPGGGKYVWNDKFQTMESTVYGNPGEPKSGPPAPPVLSSFNTGDFGLTFEHQGLRARAALERKPK